MKKVLFIFGFLLICFLATVLIASYSANERADAVIEEVDNLIEKSTKKSAERLETIPTLQETTTEETGYAGVIGDSNNGNGDMFDNDGSNEPITEYVDNRTFREIIIDTAYELYGVSEEWTIWLIGTTANEGYQADRYLEYAWACEIINCYRYWSVWELDCIWGSYYSIENAYSGYYSADDTTLEMVYEALTDRDTRIVEVDGLIDYPPNSYYLIYDSDFYNCQVWGE